jgi:hypothetical protein
VFLQSILREYIADEISGVQAGAERYRGVDLSGDHQDHRGGGAALPRHRSARARGYRGPLRSVTVSQLSANIKHTTKGPIK